MRQRTSTKDRMTPLFWGGSLSSFSTCGPGTQGEGCFKADNHSGISQIEEKRLRRISRFKRWTPPRSEPVTKIIGHCHIKNQPILRLSQPTSF